MSLENGQVDAAGTLTGLIRAASAGGGVSLDDRLIHEVREVVRRAKRRRSDARSPDTTDLLHQALERTVLAASPSSDGGDARWASRESFFAAIAKATLDALIDDHRRRTALKRGGRAVPVSLDERSEALASRLREAPGAECLSEDDLAKVAEALRELEALDSRAAAVVTLRFFYGLGMAEIAVALGQSERTVKRDWRAARAWLYRALSPIAGGGAGTVSPVSDD